MFEIPPFDPMLLMVSLAVAYALTSAFMASMTIAQSALGFDEKLMRITCLLIVPPVGLLIHHECPPPRDVIMNMRMKGWVT